MSSEESSPFRDRAPLATADALEILRTAEMEILGRMPHSSNATFLVDLSIDGEIVAQTIYKPRQGERPLWDFPSGLCQREAAAFELADGLGWDIIPPTVVRDGPLGEGSAQLFIPARFEEHYFTLQDDERYDLAFRKLCLFDYVSNNTDRKSGHCLVDHHDHIWGIDNGLSFHSEFKLRTVLWDFAGQDIEHELRTDLANLAEAGLPDELVTKLDPFEHEAALTRLHALLREGTYPIDPTGHRYPWPLV